MCYGYVSIDLKDIVINYVWPVRAGQSGSSDSSYPANIWKTGQTTSYAAGDDGDMERGVEWPNPRFNDQGNETVVDNLTGLIWTKDANAPGPSICNPGTYMTWQAALDYVSCLNTNSYLGYNDWRLPNRKELRSLIGYSNVAPALPTGHPFTSVQSYYYWSSTNFAIQAGGAGVVDVWGGGVGNVSKGDDNLYVWPVRAGQVGAFGNLTVDPTSYDFGNVVVEKLSPPQTFTISNTGTADLHVSGMTLSDTTNYSLDVSPCGSTTPTIAPDSSCTVTITFSPLSTGQKDASLTINSDDPDTSTLNVPLSGIGVKQNPVIDKILGIKEPGLIIRIIGTNFGGTQGDSVVHIGPRIFDSSNPMIKLWSDTKIRIRLPNYQCGWFKDPHFRYIKTWLTVDGIDSNKKRLKVMKPSTCSSGSSCTSCHF
jgi:hypothetical protein